ncbi:MAG: porin family protein [Chlorobiaceae bacterium]|nr:porin family protein [Chlorobiaceae bacterium]
MKKLLLLLCAVLSFGVFTAPAYAYDSYVSGNVGWTLSNDLNFKDTNDHIVIQLPLKRGVSVLGAIGSRAENVRLEGELGYQTRDLNLAGLNGKWEIVSVLANGYYDFYTEGIQPYVTAGIGAGRITLTDFFAGGYQYNWDGTTKLAYQLGAGIAIPLNNKISLDARYRYFVLSDVTNGNIIKYTPAISSVLIGLRFGL